MTTNLIVVFAEIKQHPSKINEEEWDVEEGEDMLVSTLRHLDQGHVLLCVQDIEGQCRISHWFDPAMFDFLDLEAGDDMPVCFASHACESTVPGAVLICQSLFA